MFISKKRLAALEAQVVTAQDAAASAALGAVHAEARAAAAESVAAAALARVRPSTTTALTPPTGDEKAAPGSTWLVASQKNGPVLAIWEQFGTYDAPTWSPNTRR